MEKRTLGVLVALTLGVVVGSGANYAQVHEQNQRLTVLQGNIGEKDKQIHELNVRVDQLTRKQKDLQEQLENERKINEQMISKLQGQINF